MAHPAPCDHKQDPGVLEQQRNTDREMGHRVEVAELCARDRDRSIHGLSCVPMPSSHARIALKECRNGQHESGDPTRAITAAPGVQPAAIKLVGE